MIESCAHVFIKHERGLDGFFHCVDCGEPVLEVNEEWHKELGMDDE